MIMIDHRTEMIIKGIAWSIGVISFLLLTYAILENNSEPIEKFKVVDQYEGCNVVRYTDRSNQWHYLLKCP
jgi:hypothetical protein